MAQPEGASAERPATPAARPESAAEIDWSTEPPALHASFATIASSDEEFSIVFGAVSPNLETTPTGKTFGRIVSSLRMSPGTFYRTLAVMVEIWNRWATPKNLPRFVQIKEGEKS
jgi:hypothetical protein